MEVSMAFEDKLITGEMRCTSNLTVHVPVCLSSCCLCVCLYVSLSICQSVNLRNRWTSITIELSFIQAWVAPAFVMLCYAVSPLLRRSNTHTHLPQSLPLNTLYTTIHHTDSNHCDLVPRFYALETADKRNELEAYLYGMRDKLDGPLKEFGTGDILWVRVCVCVCVNHDVRRVSKTS